MRRSCWDSRGPLACRLPSPASHPHALATGWGRSGSTWAVLRRRVLNRSLELESLSSLLFLEDSCGREWRPSACVRAVGPRGTTTTGLGPRPLSVGQAAKTPVMLPPSEALNSARIGLSARPSDCSAHEESIDGVIRSIRALLNDSGGGSTPQSFCRQRWSSSALCGAGRGAPTGH